MSMQIIDVGSEEESSAPIHLRIPALQATRETLTELDRILRQYPGYTEVYVSLTGLEEEQLFMLPTAVKVTGELYGELKVLLGRAAVGAPRQDIVTDEVESPELDASLEAPALHEELPEPPEDL
jgi:hypothetical protein